MIGFEGCFKDNPNSQYSTLISHIYLELQHEKPRKNKTLFLGKTCPLTYNQSLIPKPDFIYWVFFIRALSPKTMDRK